MQAISSLSRISNKKIVAIESRELFPDKTWHPDFLIQRRPNWCTPHRGNCHSCTKSINEERGFLFISGSLRRLLVSRDRRANKTPDFEFGSETG